MFIDPDGMAPYSVLGEVKQGPPEPEDPFIKSVTNREHRAPNGGPDCEGCTELPEVVVVAPKMERAIAYPFPAAQIATRVNPLFLIPFGVGLVAYDIGVNIEMTSNFIARVLEIFGVDSEVLRGKSKNDYQAPPSALPGFPGAARVPRKGRARWKTPNGDILEWDSQHGEIEVYDKRGNHKGAADPNTGKKVKPPKSGRKIET